MFWGGSYQIFAFDFESYLFHWTVFAFTFKQAMWDHFCSKIFTFECSLMISMKFLVFSSLLHIISLKVTVSSSFHYFIQMVSRIEFEVLSFVSHYLYPAFTIAQILFFFSLILSVYCANYHFKFLICCKPLELVQSFHFDYLRN